MCEFCSEGNITSNGFFRPREEKDNYIFRDDGMYHINVYCGCGDYTELSDIKYCPYCGRRLDGVTETEHMSPPENRAYWGIYG